jgi:hypothetical protein
MATITKTPEPKSTELDSLLNQVGKEIQLVDTPGYWEMLEQNVEIWASEVSVSQYWRTAREQLDSWRQEYMTAMGDSLISTPGGLTDFVSKGLARIQEKTLDRLQDIDDDGSSVDLAAAFNDAKEPIPLLKDLVRVRVQCRYLDGVEFLTKKLLELAKEQGLAPVRKREGRLEGYFAQHLVFVYPIAFRAWGSAITVNLRCEIQIATELSTTLWEVSHGIYEVARVGSDDPETWQWDFRDARFVSRQLGHTVHLADGLLCQLRDQTQQGKQEAGESNE